MSDRPVLVCTAGDRAGTVFDIPDGGVKIGRAEDNDIVVSDDDGVSRYHAALLFDHGSLWARDSGSRNGIYVNEKRVLDHKELSVGDVLKVGGAQFVVRWKSDAASGTAPARPPVADVRRSTSATLPPPEDAEKPVEKDGAKPAAKPSGRRWFWPFE